MQQSEIVKRALAVLRDGSAPGERAADIQPVERLAVAVLTEAEPGEVARICEVWRRLFGIELSPDRVAENLAMLRRWKSRRLGRHG
jgi:hypothetical protein